MIIFMIWLGGFLVGWGAGRIVLQRQAAKLVANLKKGEP